MLCINNYDQAPNVAGGIYFWTNEQDLAVVSFVDVPQYGAAGNQVNYQLILTADGMATYQYDNLRNLNGANSNIGFEGPTGQNGLNISYRQANFLHNGMAIGIADSWHTWVSWSPASGTIGVNGSEDITITLNADDLLGGRYEGDLILNTNDPEALETSINIVMLVTGIPDIDVAWANNPEVMDFNERYQDIFTGEPYTATMTVTNIGTDVLSVSAIWCNEDAFVAEPTQFDLDPEASQDVTITFQVAEGATGDYNGTFTIESNDPDGDYQFAVHAETLLPPVIDLSTNEIQIDLFTGDTDSRNITVTNNGDAPLRYTSSLDVISVPQRDDTKRHLRAVGPERITPSRDSRGGPDNGGYEWRSSHEWDGPRYEWIDITEDGQRLQGGDDWLSGALDLGFNFPWYGTDYNSLKANSNGFITLDANYGGFNISLPQAPNAVAPNAVMMVNNYDLNPGMAGGMYYWTNQQDMAVLSWVGVPQYGQAGNVQTFEVILESNGMVTYQYTGLQNVNGSNSNVGFESPDGQLGLNISYRQANFLENDMAIGISNNWVDWIGWEPQEGEIAAGESEDIVVTFHAEGLNEGDYVASLFIDSNDPNNARMEVTITLTVTGVALVAADWSEGAGYPDVVDWNMLYDDLFTNTAYNIPVTISNEGSALLTVENIYCENQEFTADPASFELAPGASQEVTFTFTAGDVEEHNADMVVVSNAHNAGELAIPLHARPATPPRIDVNPQAIEEMLNSGETTETRIAISNDGDALLRWSTSLDVIDNQGRDRNARHLRAVGPAREELRDDRGGPDEDGYEWRTSDEQDGPNYNWIDISEIGQSFQAADDWNSDVLDLGWNFTWYGQDYSTIRICSNGWASLDPNANSTTYNLPQCPNANAPNALFAVVGYDMAPDDGGNIYFWTNEQDMAVVSWVDIPAFMAAGTRSTSQLILKSNGMATYQFTNLQNVNGSTSTIGFETADGQGGMNISYRQAGFLHDDMAIGISNNWHNWISWEPEEGEVESGQEGDLFVTVGAEGLLGGIYEGILHILSNDPDMADVEVMISLEVTGIPEITATWDENLGFPQLIDWNAAYQDLFFGTAYDVEVTVENSGTDQLDVNDISCENQVFSADPAAFSLASGESQVVTFTMMAEGDGVHEGTMVISSNADNAPELEITVRGETFTSPIIVLSTNAMESNLFTGETDEQVIGIANDGGAVLRWDTDVIIIAEPGDQRDNNIRHLRNVGPVAVHVDDFPIQGQGSGKYTVDAKGTIVEAPSYPANPFRDSRGGPDNGGYEWRSSDERDDPGFEWIDITEDGQRLQGGDDWLSGVLDLGFNFPWYGTDYSSLKANSNGFITLDANYASVNISLPQAPNAAAPNAVLIANNYDLNPGMAGGMYFWTNQQDMAVISWVGVPQYGQAGNLQSFEIILESNGMATYQYTDLQNVNGSNSNIGFESPDGQLGLNISYRQANFLENDMAIGISNNWLNWLAWEPASGELEPNANQDVIVTFDATGLFEGAYVAELHFLSNDAENEDAVVDITLNVTDVPMVETEPAAHPFDGADDVLGFQDTYVGDMRTIAVTMFNPGSSELTVTGVQSNSDDFSTDLEAGSTVAPGNQLGFSLIFSPTDIDMRQGTIEIRTDANNVGEGDDAGLIWFDLAGMGEVPPIIVIGPDPANGYSEGMNVGDEAVERVMTISNGANEGGDDLVWTISSQPTQQERDSHQRALRTVGGQAGPVRDRRGGPDQLENQWRDNNEADGPAFEWIDVPNMDGAQQLQAGDDWNSGVLNLGFEMPYYGQNYASIRACSNGWMTFDANYAGVVYPLPQMPNANAVNSTVSVVGYDLDPSDGGQMWFWTNNQDMAVVSWVNVPAYRDNNIRHTMEVVLNANGFIKIQYGVQENLVDADMNVGFENQNGQIGFSCYYHEAGVREGLAVGFGPRLVWGIPWLTIDPMEGTTGMGETTDVILTFSADGLEDGNVYTGVLTIDSNDPETPSIDIDISLSVGFELPPNFEFGETGTNHSLLITDVTFDGDAVPNGWVVGVYTPDGVLSGAGVWRNQQLGIAVWGADENYPDQFSDGEMMNFRIWDNQADVEWPAVASVEEGDLHWTDRGMTVLSLAGITAREIEVPFRNGWNLISINVVPTDQNLWAGDPGPEIIPMMSQLRVDGNNHHVVLMKDERGRFYSPGRNFNNIPYWNLAEGYQVQTNEAISAFWTGTPIDPQADVDIAQGWNMVAYWPDYELMASAGSGFYVISPIVDDVIIAKDGMGNFMVPSRNYSGMPPWHEGLGYQVNMRNARTLNYPENPNAAAALTVGETSNGHWAEVVPTGANMSVLISDIKGAKLSANDQVAAFNTSGALVGVGFVTDGQIGLAVWGDDASTEAIDGLLENEAFTLKLWDADREQVVDLGTVALEGKGLVYKTDDFTVVSANVELSIPTSYYLGQNYPNPFNAVTRVAFGLPEASHVTIRVFDVAGREVSTLVSGELKAGHHNVMWNGNSSPTGLYLVKMDVAGFEASRKVLLIK